MSTEDRRNPERILWEITKEEQRKGHGRLKIFSATPRAWANPQKCCKRDVAAASAEKTLLSVRSSRNPRPRSIAC